MKKFQKKIIRTIKEFLHVHKEEKARHCKNKITYKLNFTCFTVSQKLKTKNKISATYKLKKQNSYMKLKQK